MKKKLSVKNIYLLSVIGIGLIGLALGSTYAMFITNVEIDNPISLNTNLSSENDIIETVEVTVPSSDHIEVPLTINNQSSSTLNYSTFYVSSSSGIEVGTKLSNSDSSVPTGTISSNTTKKVYVQIKNNTSSSLTITLGISSSINNIVLSSNMTIVPNTELVFTKNLVEYINSLYNDSTKTKATNNNITYNYATSFNLMNDRLGSSSTEIDAGNIRYYGASPNNYIYFNCDDYSNQTSSTCELWRIIGVFDGKIKIMRESLIGKYSWDNKNTSTSTASNDGKGKNDWSIARLMKLLNPSDYYTTDTNDYGRGQSLYWDGKSGTCFAGSNSATASCDFTSLGLKNDITRNMISEAMWYLRGWNTNEIYVDQMYNYERTKGRVSSGRPTTWTGKIALAYQSDYGYAADLRECQQQLSGYNVSTCTGSNWMKNVITNNGSNSGWLLTPYPSYAYSASFVFDSGIVYGNSNMAYHASSIFGVVPTLYLNSELKIKLGDGSSSLPYQLSM